MKKKEAESIFKSFNQLTVLVVGDSMVDSYVHGKVNRISPEAPVPIVSVSSKENRPGGAANVALNIQALGATPILCSIIGIDSNAKLFMEILKKSNLSSEGIFQSKKRITTVKTRIIGNNHQLIRIDEENENVLTAEEEKSFVSKLNQLFSKKKIDVVIIEDYNKGLLTPFVIKSIITEAKKNNVPVVVDPKKENFYEYKNVSLFKPNLKEFKESIKTDFNNADKHTLDQVTDQFREKQKVECVMVTLSEKGVYINNGKEKKIIPAHKRNISDVSGAGDTVISVAALCIALGLKPLVTASLANLAGGLVCEYVGVIPIDKEKLFREALLIDL